MGQVSVSVNNQRYTLACRDGEEDRLLSLARLVDGKVRMLTARLGQVGDTKLILMAALLLADEMDDLRTQLGRIKEGKGTASEGEAAARITKILNEMADSTELFANELERT
ncbi:MAG TPA: cell division protein ZapA [Sphingomonadales bacterium]|nr:cell division protein ZapA [Sphingomonadales bacterium]